MSRAGSSRGASCASLWHVWMALPKPEWIDPHRPITVEAGEDVGAIRFGLAISSWRCQLDFPGSRLSSVGQRPRAFRHGLRADASRQVGLLRLAH